MYRHWAECLAWLQADVGSLLVAAQGPSRAVVAACSKCNLSTRWLAATHQARPLHCTMCQGPTAATRILTNWLKAGVVFGNNPGKQKTPPPHAPGPVLCCGQKGQLGASMQANTHQHFTCPPATMMPA
jgi:hypothetical protein